MMSVVAPSRGCEFAAKAQSSALTLVELIFVEKVIEYRIRFGHPVHEEILDRRRRLVGFVPDSVFAFVRWAGNDFGTIISRIDIVRTVGVGEPYQTLPFVRLGGEILLKIEGWPRVERVLQAIDSIEAIGLDPVEVSPDFWRHLHNRLIAGEGPRVYGTDQHRAYLLRKRAQP